MLPRDLERRRVQSAGRQYSAVDPRGTSGNSEQSLFELCTRLIMEHDVDMTRQGVSNHLEVLEEVGMVASTRRGKYKVLEFAGKDQINAVAAWLDRLVENDAGTETERS